MKVIEFNSNLETAQNRHQIEGELHYLRHEQGLVHHFEDIKGNSQRFKNLLQEVKKVVNTDATVLILGETGTGKELIAGAVHHSGQRKGKPFIKVNCAALPETLLESELFGHEKGAFTGAHKQRIGRVEQANGGTLFLDEIAEMSLGMQSKLLRVLQQREFERVGGTQTIRVDIRLIAATNKELQEAINTGNFREDLFYRLNVFPIHMPSLRERKEDIQLLADYFMKKYCAQYAKKVQGISDNAQRVMKEYSWPGNVRELENAIERAVLLVDANSEISPKELGLPAGASSTTHKSISIKLPPEGISMKDVEKELIIQALELTGWVQKDAARLLGMSKRAMNYRVKQYRITHTGWAKNKESN